MKVGDIVDYMTYGYYQNQNPEGAFGREESHFENLPNSKYAPLPWKINEDVYKRQVYVWITPTMIIQKSSMLLSIHSSPRALHEVFMVLPRRRTNSCMQTSW